MPGPLATRTRRQLVTDAEWYRSIGFNEYRRVAHVDHSLNSVCQTSHDGVSMVITIHRAIGERDFSPREQRLLDFLHGEIGPLIGRSLVSAAEPGPREAVPGGSARRSRVSWKATARSRSRRASASAPPRPMNT